jgi:hypothetical protein
MHEGTLGCMACDDLSCLLLCTWCLCDGCYDVWCVRCDVWPIGMSGLLFCCLRSPVTDSVTDHMLSLVCHSCLVYLGVNTHNAGKPCVHVLCDRSSFLCTLQHQPWEAVDDTEALLCWPVMVVWQGRCIAT